MPSEQGLPCAPVAPPAGRAAPSLSRIPLGCRVWPADKRGEKRPPVEGEGAVAKELNVLALIKGEDRYVYVYDDASRQALIDLLHAQAADPDLSLNWFDSVVLANK